MERYSCDAYGQVEVLDADWSSDADGKSDYANEILFAGYRFDSETGLYHVRHRMYHATLGRWLQRDPIGYEAGMGLYLYAAGSPARYVDAQGMMAGLPFMPRFDTNLEKEAIGLYTDFTLAAKVPNILSIFGIEGIPLGAAGGGGASAMFFPSTCELAVFKQRGGAFAAWDDPDKEERFHREYSLGEDHEGGVGAGVDAGLQMATYMGQGEASADSYTGYFHTPSGGYLIGAGSAFVSDDGKWAGASFGGAWGTPTGAFMSWYYTLESSVDLDDKYKTKGRCACYCINFFAPDGPTHLAAIVNRNAREWGEGAAEARRSSGVTDTSGTGLPNRAAPPPIPPAGRSLPDPIPVPP